MAKSVPVPVEGFATRSGLIQEERLRVAGAFAALLLAALVLSGGLLWREHARARDHRPPPPAAAEAR
ncbi:MAG TPA: hypothetical protein VMU15_13595 [Anaeromyxobacter sp.]|nr:hypothetical protein [Anaeromyxobacter sp.]